MTLKTSADELAEKIAEEALTVGTSMEARLEALKVIAQYLTVAQKLQKKTPDETEGTMADFRREMDEADGETPVRTRQ